MVAQQTLAQRIARGDLHPRIERGAHPQPARIDRVCPVLGGLAEALDQLAAHFLEEIASLDSALAALGDEPQRLGRRCPPLGPGDEAIGLHLAQHEIAPFERGLLLTLAAIAFGRLGQDREEGHLVQFEIIDVLVEIGARCRLHPERTPSERDLVEIEFEDFLFGQHLFDAPGEDHFLELAGDRIFIAQKQVLGDLLGDGRTAHRALARAELGGIIEHRIGCAEEIDPAVAEEGLVLGRQIGFDQLLREIGILQLHPPLACIGVDDCAIMAAHHGRQRGFIGE